MSEGRCGDVGIWCVDRCFVEWSVCFVVGLSPRCPSLFCFWRTFRSHVWGFGSEVRLVESLVMRRVRSYGTGDCCAW
jgi:hypothetical protein